MGSAFSGRSLAPPPGSVNLPMRPCRFHDGGNGVAGQKVTASGSDTEHVTSADGSVSLLLEDGDVTISVNGAQAYKGAVGSLKAKERFGKDGTRLAA